MTEALSIQEIKLIVGSILKKYNSSEITKEDLFLEGVLAALHAIEEYDQKFETKLTTYIYLRIERKFISIIRAEKAQKRKPKEKINYEATTLEETGTLFEFKLRGEYHTNNYLPYNYNQEQEYQKEETINNLKKEIRKILKKDELNLLKEIMEGRKYKEISQRENKTPRSIANKVYYIKKKLKDNQDKFEKFK